MLNPAVRYMAPWQTCPKAVKPVLPHLPASKGLGAGREQRSDVSTFTSAARRHEVRYERSTRLAIRWLAT